MCIRAREDCNPSRARALREERVPKGAGNVPKGARRKLGHSAVGGCGAARSAAPHRMRADDGMMRGCGGNGYAAMS